jgi:hypothetical protein
MRMKGGCYPSTSTLATDPMVDYNPSASRLLADKCYAGDQEEGRPIDEGSEVVKSSF